MLLITIRNLISILSLSLIAVIRLNVNTPAQSSTPEDEFIIGAKLGNTPYKVDETIKSYFDCGFNAIWWDAYSDSKPFLEKFDGVLLADHGRSRKDYIYHYATSYYSVWEAEENQTKEGRVGIKHKGGKLASWKGVDCWSSIGLSSSEDSFIYGPHYRQDKRYKRWLYNEPNWSRYYLDFNVRYKMALVKSSRVQENDDVCRIKVVYCYAEEYASGGWKIFETVFQQKTLKVKDFRDAGEFTHISFDKTYRYPEKFWQSEVYDSDNPNNLKSNSPKNINYNDTEAGLGIQFCVEWLSKDDLCTLYVDNIEVYDNDGWNDYIKQPRSVEEKILEYLNKYPKSKYPYLKYWYAHDEPYSIDAFRPFYIVDSIITSAGREPLITEFYPYWTHDGKINGEDFLQLWYEIGKPKKLMIDFYPFSPSYPFRSKDVEELRLRFQKCHELQPKFWYSAQASGYWSNSYSNWIIWRLPTAEEFNASIMLGLAHGMTGIILFSYTSFGGTRGIVDNRDGVSFTKTHLWYHLKDNLIPRLKGNLGKTLMGLNYTGDYLNLEYQKTSSSRQTEFDYLKIHHSEKNYFWHVGFFTDKDSGDNKYFLITNLLTSNQVTAKLTIQNITDYKNLSFRDIDGGKESADTTIGYNSLITYNESIPAGDGKLYQVSPVIKYGGRLLYSESTENGMTLADEMIIENGAVLTINGDYYAKANITIKNGRVAYKNNGKIHFESNKKLLTK